MNLCKSIKFRQTVMLEVPCVFFFLALLLD